MASRRAPDSLIGYSSPLLLPQSISSIDPDPLDDGKWRVLFILRHSRARPLFASDFTDIALIGQPRMCCCCAPLPNILRSKGLTLIVNNPPKMSVIQSISF